MNRRIAGLSLIALALLAIGGCNDGKKGLKRSENEVTVKPPFEEKGHFFDGYIRSFSNHELPPVKRVRSAESMMKYVDEGVLTPEQKKTAIETLEKSIPTTEDPDVKAAYEKCLAKLKEGK